MKTIFVFVLSFILVIGCKKKEPRPPVPTPRPTSTLMSVFGSQDKSAGNHYIVILNGTTVIDTTFQVEVNPTVYVQLVDLRLAPNDVVQMRHEGSRSEFKVQAMPVFP